ncbi:MAG TPA: low molecular weight protein-tyrosine-phosphatase [Moheibacter sp.]|nr:low molecular weight protein-tyrosine-phosphatase [Moheibacter sp.]
MKILMVCLGNICRSPLAEGILRAKLNNGYFIDSAGIGDWHVGQPPDKRSVSIARKYGIDISSQTARQFRSKDFDDFDLILVMDESNYDEIISLANSEEQKAKVRLILEHSDLENKNVPDPYFGGEDEFESVYQLLDEATNVLIEKIKLP